MAEKIGELFAKWWGVILATIIAGAGIASAWGFSTAQIAALGAGQSRIEAKLETITTDLQAAKTAAAVAAMEVMEFRERLRTVEQRQRLP